MISPLEACIAREIKNARIKLGFKQESLASAVHISVSSVSKIESGTQRLRLDQLLAITEYLDIPPEEIIRGAKKRLRETKAEAG